MPQSTHITGFRKKSKNKKEIKSMFGFGLSNGNPLGYICGTISLSQDFINGLGFLDADFVLFGSDEGFTHYDNIVFCPYEDVAEIVSGFDFFVCSESSEQSQYFIQKGIVPIVQKRHYLNNLLKEFDTVMGTGNCFFYRGDSCWSLMRALMKYNICHSFSNDYRNLLKNIQAF